MELFIASVVYRVNAFAIRSAAVLEEACAAASHAAFRPSAARSRAGGALRARLPRRASHGGGKSLCYQFPAAMGRGLVLVVSAAHRPADDQVGLRAPVSWPPTLCTPTWRTVAAAKPGGTPDGGKDPTATSSPERLLAGGLPVAARARLVLAAVDEAHCISHWGHEFRPDYRRLAAALKRFPHASRMALTATATPAVQDDICAQLCLRAPARLIGHPDRPNLVYRACPRREQSAQVLEVARRHPGEGGIVYARTRKDVERLAEGLAGAGVLAATTRLARGPQTASRRLVSRRLDLVAATWLSPGIDRPDVRLWSMPIRRPRWTITAGIGPRGPRWSAA